MTPVTDMPIIHILMRKSDDDLNRDVGSILAAYSDEDLAQHVLHVLETCHVPCCLVTSRLVTAGDPLPYTEEFDSSGEGVPSPLPLRGRTYHDHA